MSVKSTKLISEQSLTCERECQLVIPAQYSRANLLGESHVKHSETKRKSLMWMENLILKSNVNRQNE